MERPMRLKDLSTWVRLPVLRALERVLPPALLSLVLWPFVAATVLCDLVKYRRYRRDWRPVPRSLLPEGPGLRLFQSERMQVHFSRLVTFWPDRLAQSRWQARCRYEGLEPLIRARESRTPILLATLHFGPLPLLRYLLRARQLPVAGLSGQAQSERGWRQRTPDALAALPKEPHVFPVNELKAARQFLQGGGCLLVAMDANRGKQVEVVTPHGVLGFGTGAIRLAQSTGARLVPCLIYQESPWRFVVHCGRPAELETAAGKSSPEAVAEHLVREFLPVLVRHPEHWGLDLMNAWRI